jgi:hypothetical protein
VLAALGLLLLPAALVHGFDYTPVPGVAGSEKPGRRLDFVLSAAVGTDTNLTRVASDAGPEKKSGSIYELLAGAELVGSNLHTRYILGAETRLGQSPDFDGYDFQEYSTKAGFWWRTRKASLSLTGRFASANDPVEAETFKLALLERRVVSYEPRLGFVLGKLGLEAGYGFRSVEFDDYTLSYLDHTNVGLDAELSLWSRPEVTRMFLRYDSATVDYEDALLRSDLEYAKYCVGWRTGSATKSHYEFSVGGYTIGGDIQDDGVGPVISVRSAIHRNQGNSRFEMAYSIGPEAAATADYKKAQRIQVAYVRKANQRWSWSLRYRNESSDFETPDKFTSDMLSLHVLSAGLQGDLGSPGRWRGRLYCTLLAEMTDDFDRLRALVGLGLAH